MNKVISYSLLSATYGSYGVCIEKGQGIPIFLLRYDKAQVPHTTEEATRPAVEEPNDTTARKPEACCAVPKADCTSTMAGADPKRRIWDVSPAFPLPAEAQRPSFLFSTSCTIVPQLAQAPPVK